MTQLTHAQLSSAHDRQDWYTLWMQAVPLVASCVGSMHRKGELRDVDRDDMLQEGNLAAGAAIRKWKPLESTLGTWVWVCVRSRLLSLTRRAGYRDSLIDAGADVEQLPSDVEPEDVDLAALPGLLARLDEEERAAVIHRYDLGGQRDLYEGNRAALVRALAKMRGE